VIEKLLENWLDSASERSYQAVFVQLLSAEGYTVLHSTRHCLLEFGKDILAIAPDGVGCAFQLKGAPGGRMTVGEFRREIQYQLVQLMAQTPSFPGFPVGGHRAYLVSNGQFEEEVQVAVQEMNNSPYPAKVELWARGKLFELCKKHSALLWPSELRDNRSLLELYMANADAQLPLAKLGEMLESVLGLDRTASDGDAEFSRRVSSATWLTGICLSSYAEKENHQAVALGWTLCAALLVAVADRRQGRSATIAGACVELSKKAALDALAALWGNIEEREQLLEGSLLAESEVMGWRLSLLLGLMAVLAIADQDMDLLLPQSRTSLHSWLKKTPLKAVLWGEAAVASLVPWVVWLRKVDATARPDEEIYRLAQVVVVLNQQSSNFALANPYYDGEAALRHTFGMQNPNSLQIAKREQFHGAAYTATSLFHLLARTNMKTRCKSLWPNFSRLTHHRLSLDFSWDYCRLRAPTGINESKIFPSTYSWVQLKKDATEAPKKTNIPETMETCPWFLALWWQAAPHRMNEEATWVFTEAVLPNWGS
jgi:hypothetical protein